MTQPKQSYILMLSTASVFLVWSAIRPHDYFTWLLEIFPAVIALIVIAFTHKRFPLTTFSYWLITIHAIILIIGGHYTYAEMPLFNWLRDIGVFGRNNYDKIGHFYQGFGPAIIIREVLIRKNILPRGRWLTFIILCIVLAFSAFYEFIEWWIALLVGSKGDAFLGTQGYVWDTQSDMLMALIGASLALFLLSKQHDRALQKLSTQ